MVINTIKKMFGSSPAADEYVEIDVNGQQERETKVIVKPFVLRQYDDINDILNSIREGYTIAVIDMKPLKTKDVIELKRAVAKIKKTVDAIEGQIAAFGDTTIIVTPKFAEIHRAPAGAAIKKPDYINE
ncbi:cell division protein SepF [Candidatus Pacearchaeota archaeon]|nr:cell division protein SepF [Candidatus Pacearchaeota archaeon]